MLCSCYQLDHNEWLRATPPLHSTLPLDVSEASKLQDALAQRVRGAPLRTFVALAREFEGGRLGKIRFDSFCYRV